MNKKIYMTFIAMACVFTASGFAFFWNLSQLPIVPEIFLETKYDQEKNFIFTGITASSLSGAEIFFRDKIAITGIQNFMTSKKNMPVWHAEYPDFEHIAPKKILSPLHKNIEKIHKNQNSLEEILGYHAHFSLNSGKNFGSIHYEIFKNTPNYSQKIETLNFLIEKNGNIFSPKNLVKTEKIPDLQDIFVQTFQEKYPKIPLHTGAILEKNLWNYFENPNFSFSGNTMIWDFKRNIFTENTENIETFLQFEIPYENLSGAILTENPHKEEIFVEKKSDDGKKYVALTFDDGPHKTYTPELLKILETKNVKATFYLLGQNIERNPEIVKKIYESGHEIGHHSLNHKSFKKISAEDIQNQMKTVDAMIKNITGEETKTFRPPYGAYDAKVIKLVNKAIIMWSIDSLDWKNRNVQKNLKLTINSLHDGAIILYHDIHKTSIETIPTLIDAIREAWYEFLTVEDLYKKYHNEIFFPGQECFSMKKCQ